MLEIQIAPCFNNFEGCCINIHKIAFTHYKTVLFKGYVNITKLICLLIWGSTNYIIFGIKVRNRLNRWLSWVGELKK